LSTRDRLELAIELWDSVESSAELPPLNEHQLAELDRRLGAYIADSSATLSADETLDQLERELR
jgi:putative addiction module component (TIGR02574 family)